MVDTGQIGRRHVSIGLPVHTGCFIKHQRIGGAKTSDGIQVDPGRSTVEAVPERAIAVGRQTGNGQTHHHAFEVFARQLRQVCNRRTCRRAVDWRWCFFHTRVNDRNGRWRIVDGGHVDGRSHRCCGGRAIVDGVAHRARCRGGVVRTVAVRHRTQCHLPLGQRGCAASRGQGHRVAREHTSDVAHRGTHVGEAQHILAGHITTGDFHDGRRQCGAVHIGHGDGSVDGCRRIVLCVGQR